MMSNSYSIEFNKDFSPTPNEIESFACSLEPSFRLGSYFNYMNEGFCQCKFKRKKQGFEWEFEDINNDQNILAELIFRSDAGDGLCALLVATSIAYLARGCILYEDKKLYGEDILIWAREEINIFLSTLAVMKKQKKGLPEDVFLSAISLLENTKIKDFIQLSGTAALISIIFPTNMRLMGQQWSLLLSNYNFSTQSLPVYALSKEEEKKCKESIDKIKHMILQDNIQQVVFDKNSLDVQLYFESGELVFHARSTYVALDDISKFRLHLNQGWDFLDGNQRITILPDIELNKLKFC